ncbi:MAG: hypothetical protein ACN6O3_10020 [Comamonas sp.]
MEAIISRPAVGAKSPSTKKAAKPQPAPIPTRSEGDVLALKAAETLQTMVMSVMYDNDSTPRELENSHFEEVVHLLGRLLDPSNHERDRLDPDEGDVLGHLREISEEISYACNRVDEVGSISSVTLPMQVVLTNTLYYAEKLADRICRAYEGLPGTLEELRALTTFAGAKPYRDRPTPPIRRAPAAVAGPKASPLYPLARSWSEKVTRTFAMLEDAMKTLQAENSSSAALPALRLSLEQLSACDEEGELLNALAGLNQAPAPALTAAPHRYTQEQLVTVLESIAGYASTLNHTLMQAQQCGSGDSARLAVLVDAAQLHASLVGSIADDASGGVIIGDFNCWFHGSNFAKQGGAA